MTYYINKSCIPQMEQPALWQMAFCLRDCITYSLTFVIRENVTKMSQNNLYIYLLNFTSYHTLVFRKTFTGYETTD